MKLAHVGYGCYVDPDKVVAVVDTKKNTPKPLQRLIQEAQQDKKMVNITYGKKVRTILIMSSGHVILSSREPETIAVRVNKEVDMSA